jgi:type I restriction enzyme S subunit
MSNLNYEQVAWPKTPKDWEIVRLEELITKKRETFDDTDFEKLPVKSINNEKGFVDSEEQFDKQVYSEELGNYSVVRPGEFAYNPARINVGSIAYQDLEKPVLISPMYEVFSVDETRLNPEYFRQFISTEKAVSLFGSFSQGSIRKNLKFKLMKDIPFALPPLEEQKKIASMLQKVDTSIDETDSIVDYCSDLKQGIFQDLINQGNYSEVGLEELIEDTTYGTNTKSEKNENGTPILRIPNISEGRLKLSDLKYSELSEEDKQKYSLEEGDILIVRTNGTPEYVGRTVVFPETENDFAFASYLIRIRLDSSKILPKYFSAYLNSPFGRSRLNELIRTSAGNYNLGVKSLKTLSIPVPPLDDQREIAEKLSVVDEKIQQEEEYREKLEELKKGLMQDLLTGEVRVEGK